MYVEAVIETPFQVQDVAKEKQAYADDRLLVKISKENTPNVLSKYGLKVKKSLGRSDWKVVTVPKGQAARQAERVGKDKDVLGVSLDYVMKASRTPDDPSFFSQYHHQSITSEGAWDVSVGSPDFNVAFLDTGIDLQHPDLALKIVPGYDFVNKDWNPDDDHGHGTHCAGIAAATGGNGELGSGVDWNAGLLPVKVLNESGTGYSSDVIDGLYFAVDAGADVLAVPLGGGGYQQAFQEAVNYAWSNNRIVVAAAGNDGSYPYTYPAAYSNVIAVTSVDGSGSLSYFSNRGTWVDVAAPGSSIYSAKSGGGMTTMSGTSMAASAVAGVASLVWSAYPEETNADVRDRILYGTSEIPGTGSYFWYGLVNAHNSISPFYCCRNSIID